MHLFTESNHYEALSREYALIKSLGLNNLTNAINGWAYGDMKTDWNQIVNYGNMLLYNAFKMAIQENPPLIFKEDIIEPKVREKASKMIDYELVGILDCFLEL